MAASPCANSRSWIIRLGTVLSDHHNDNSKSNTVLLYENPRPCTNPVVFGVSLSPPFEMLLSLAIPLLFGLVLGAYLQKKSLEKKTKTASRWPFLRNAWPLIRALRMPRVPSKDATFADQEDISDHQDRVNVIKPTYEDTIRESGIQTSKLPKHIAVIMDGNRRYGKRVYGVPTRGHLDGGKKACQFVEWCDTEGIPVVTLFAFSSENWNRSKTEVDFLMELYEEALRVDLRPLVFNRQIRVNHLYTEKDRIPASLLKTIDNLRDETKDFHGKTVLNVCMSYGGRPEIVNASQSIAQCCLNGTMTPAEITEDVFAEHLTTSGMPEPDLLIRTSGEYRISNFLLWQLAYAEFFFTKCDWPEIEKTDLLSILQEFAKGRERRFGG